MPTRQQASYGCWKSPITSTEIASASIRFGDLETDGNTVYWTEGRAAEAGRNVVVRWTPDGKRVDLTPEPFNVRTRVHDGGGAMLIVGGSVYFSNFVDQRLYRQEPDREPHPITPDADRRYADAVYDAHRGRIVCVCEDHTIPVGQLTNTIVALDPDGEHEPMTLVSGSDFVSNPRVSPDGSSLAWVSWDHPNMPWDGTELHVAEFRTDGSLGEAVCVAGGAEESIFQPEWAPNGTLWFVSDRSGWWNLHR